MTMLNDLDLVLNTDPTIGPELDWVGFNGRWFAGVDVANAPTSRDFVMAGLRQDYSFLDGATTSGSTMLTSARGGFTSALVGASISGAGIPAGTTITAVAVDGAANLITMSEAATETASGVRVTIITGLSQDLAYWRHRDALSPTLGIGVTPPDGKARLQVSAQDTEPAMGTVRLRRGPAQTGNVLTLHDSAPTDRLWVDATFWVSGNHSLGGALLVQADPSHHRAVVMSDNRTTLFGFEFLSPAQISFGCISSGSRSFNVGTSGALQHVGPKLGLFSAPPVARPTVTGSRSDGTALASLLTALQSLGAIVDNTTP